MRSPALGDNFEFRRRGARGETLQLLHGDHQCEVSGGPRVGPSERAQQVDVRRPRADSFHLQQLRLHRHVVQLAECFEIEFAAGDRTREVSAVGGLLATEARASEFGVVEFEETCGRERGRGEREETLESGVGRSERNLLFQDDVDEGGEIRRAKPLGRLAVLRQKTREVRVARGQVSQPFGVRSSV